MNKTIRTRKNSRFGVWHICKHYNTVLEKQKWRDRGATGTCPWEGSPEKESELGMELMVFPELTKSLNSIILFFRKKGLPLHPLGEAKAVSLLHSPTYL